MRTVHPGSLRFRLPASGAVMMVCPGNGCKDFEMEDYFATNTTCGFYRANTSYPGGEDALGDRAISPPGSNTLKYMTIIFGAFLVSVNFHGSTVRPDPSSSVFQRNPKIGVLNDRTSMESRIPQTPHRKYMPLFNGLIQGAAVRTYQLPSPRQDDAVLRHLLQKMRGIQETDSVSTPVQQWKKSR